MKYINTYNDFLQIFEAKDTSGEANLENLKKLMPKEYNGHKLMDGSAGSRIRLMFDYKDMHYFMLILPEKRKVSITKREHDSNVPKGDRFIYKETDTAAEVWDMLFKKAKKFFGF